MYPGRPLEFDPDVALDAAMTVFWQLGFEATSLPDLLKAMGLSKSSFYNAFGSKQQLFETCLERFRARQVRRMGEGLSQAASPLAFIREMLLSNAAEARQEGPRRGCLIMNTATEFAGRDPAVAGLVSTAARDFAGMFRQAVEKAQARGEIPATANSEVLAHYLLTTMAGLRTMVKARLPAEKLEEVVALAVQALR
ncbi:TetR/AcrR family transcriptional regulator [Aromatoleum toluclasticum]|uniref:TetR/AcrR family transcriptional regulator n=1 Tax=Aromatoleum toluclasticum TaxID=92003 RepID=UPI001D1880BB|nr:TetR/AcrR family transcriptional regulator [Aromatoleum toluclasticum]MCC4118153.1 TetR/AcrR family transcriptional regulator [Aromatoleum toluclasticum]